MKPLYLVLSLFAAVSCSKGLAPDSNPVDISDSSLLHDELVLGRQLDNPYSIENMKSAYQALYPTKSADALEFTDYYVRFLPCDDGQLQLLKDRGLSLMDHPMDYEIVKEGDYYHDPSLDREDITWQYAVVPKDFVFPSAIRHEVLQKCFLVENSQSTKADLSVDWEAVESEAFRLSGNASMLEYESEPGTKATKVQPSGRICIIDDNCNGAQPIGVSEVKVECNVFVKFSSAYTDRDGYYQIPKSFSSNPRYRLVFVNRKGFHIGLNTILYRGSVSSLGKNSNSGVNITINSESDRKLFRRCVANNAAYDYYDRCQDGTLGIEAPPSDITMWMFDNFDASSTVMLHHGTVLDADLEFKYYKIFLWVVQLFAPDITLGTQNCITYRQIYSTVIHELAHASYFTRVGVKYWNKYIYYILSSAIKGSDLYGDSSMSNSGYCALGEMWAYYLESKLYAQRYGCSNPMFGSNNWFHPQLLTSLENRGLTTAQIFEAFGPEITDLEKLREKMTELYPSKITAINQAFNRYE